MDATRVKGPLNQAFRFSVGSDRAIIHLRPEHQRDLQFLIETCGFEYVRFHGLLNEEMQIIRVGPTGELVYDWTNVDDVYDFLVRDLKIRPIVELGFMPEPLASGKQTIFWWKGNVTRPKSYEQWGQFIEQLTRHLTERYGADEVRKWSFEVWNEPNLDGFWGSTSCATVDAAYLRIPSGPVSRNNPGLKKSSLNSTSSRRARPSLPKNSTSSLISVCSRNAAVENSFAIDGSTVES